MNKFTALLNLFRRGSMVADPAKWKARHITVAMVAGVILAAVHALEAFGYALPIDAEDAAVLAAAVLLVADLVWVPTTTDKIGLPPVGGDTPPAPRQPPDDLGPDPRA